MQHPLRQHQQMPQVNNTIKISPSIKLLQQSQIQTSLTNPNKNISQQAKQMLSIKSEDNINTTEGNSLLELSEMEDGIFYSKFNNKRSPK